MVDVDELDCCVGEPAMGDPHGLHTHDCPVYQANVTAWLERRPKPEPARDPADVWREAVGASTSAALRQTQAALHASQQDLTRVEGEKNAMARTIDRLHAEIAALKADGEPCAWRGLAENLMRERESARSDTACATADTEKEARNG